MRLRLDLAYDGTAFAGWAAQRDQRTVQGELEAALARILRRDDLPHLVVAGRTDAGVHARGQVAHLDLPPAPRLDVPAGTFAEPDDASAEAPTLPAVPPRSLIHGDFQVVSDSESTSNSTWIMGKERRDVPAGTSAEPDDASAEAAVAWENAVPGVVPGSPLPEVPDTTGELLADLREGGTDQLLRRLNGTLPHDIRIRRVSLAPKDFDARFCGVSRTYSYRIADRPEAVDPLRRFDTLHWPRSLELALLQEASAGLVGLHDFAAFCKRRENASTIRALLRLDWTRDESGVLIATVQADAFCHSMVRSLMGALIAVGERRQPATWPASLLQLDVRCSGVLVAPPQGLTLEHVEYPPDDQLAARQLMTRRPRG